MKKLLIALSLGALFFSGSQTTLPKVAECAWCVNSVCWGANSCGPGCHCFKSGTNPSGSCYSIDRTSDLLEHGYEILP